MLEMNRITTIFMFVMTMFTLVVWQVSAASVDGGYTEWSKYSECSKTCGNGTQERQRNCTNPSPAQGGKDCQGANNETRSCNIKECPVNGGFTAWTNYSNCSKPCGNGTQERTRNCTNPSPAHGGKNCVGDTSESQSCNVQECLVNGGFTAWTNYSKCSKPCGNGTQERTRNCTNPSPAHGGKNCVGDTSESQSCNVQECLVNGGFTAWTNYSKCSKPCGNGTQERTRNCTNPSPAHGGKNCVGDKSESQSCNVKECSSVNGGFTAWTSYGKCSKTCGDDGIQARTRTCTNPLPALGGVDCVGNTVESKSCFIKHCPGSVSSRTVVGISVAGAVLVVVVVVVVAVLVKKRCLSAPYESIE